MEKSRSKSWVGNIYHKFEAVCQEVDEFVTKDTVKYVENQVQNVGANMKRLYSGVVPDFFIPVDDHVKREAQAVNGKPKHAVGANTSSVTGTAQNPIKEQLFLDQYADNSLESHNPSTSTELEGVIASEEAEIDLSVGNECATAICKNSCKVFKENITKEEALVDDEPSTSKDRVSSESYSDKDSKDTMCYSFSDDDKWSSDATESISNVSTTLTNLHDNVTSEDQLASKESSSVTENFLPQTSALTSDIPPTSPNDAGFGVSMTVCKSSLDDVTCVSKESSTTWALKDAPSTFQSSELVLPRVLNNESMDVDAGISNSSLLAESSSLSTSLIGNCMQEAESDFSISTDLSSSLSTSLASANNVVSVIPALSSTPSWTDFSEVNASSSHESVGNAGSVRNDLDWCPSTQLKVLICPAEIGRMNDSSIDLPGMETIDLTDKGKLKESCALVDNKLHNLVSFRPRKYKSYKELIQEAFASRKRLIKEYKQLAVLYADVDAETSQHVELSQLPSLPSPCLHSTESSTCNICELGWELL